MIVEWAILMGSWAMVSETPDRIRHDLQWEGAAVGASLTGSAGDAWKRVEQRGSLTSQDLFRIALPQSERIARAAEEYYRATFNQDRVVAAVLPSVTVAGTQFFQQDASAQGGVTAPDRSEFKLTATQPLFRGFREFAGWRLEEAGMEQKRWAFQTEKRALFGVVAEAFYTMLFHERETQILEESLKNARERVREMKARHEQGMSRRTEVLLIETQAATEEAQSIIANQALDQSRRDVEFLLGRPLTVSLYDAEVAPVLPGSLDDAVRRAWATRSESREREAELRAAEEFQRVVSGEYWPNLDLSGNVYGYRRNFSASQQATTWDVQIALTWPFFQGGDVGAREGQAASAFRTAALNQVETRRRIEVEVRNAFAQWVAGAKLLVTLETRERTAHDAYTQVLNEYRQGIAGVTNLEVSVAHDRWLAAQIERDRQGILRKLDGLKWQMVQGILPEEGQ